MYELHVLRYNAYNSDHLHYMLTTVACDSSSKYTKSKGHIWQNQASVHQTK